MSLRPFFAKLLAPSAVAALFILSGVAHGGCYFGGQNVQCDEHGENCQVCDQSGCHAADPSVDFPDESSSSGTTNPPPPPPPPPPPCEPEIATCGCAKDADCPTGLICIDGLCVIGCNNSLECGNGKVCVNGKCEVGCDDQSPCFAGYVCVNGYCNPNAASPMCDGIKPCEQTSSICVEGICKTPCTSHADCTATEVCDATVGACIPNPNPVPACGPNNPCPGSAQCLADGYCHYGCTEFLDCKLIDNRFYACDQGICKTEAELKPECSLDKPCPIGKDCVSNKCL